MKHVSNLDYIGLVFNLPILIILTILTSTNLHAQENISRGSNSSNNKASIISEEISKQISKIQGTFTTQGVIVQGFPLTKDGPTETSGSSTSKNQALDSHPVENTLVSPNLTAPYFYWASTSPVAEGESYWIKSDIKNIGDGSAGASYAKAYLSTDNDFDITDDYYLGEKSVNSLGAGATQTIQWDFNFPNIGSGTYQVWIIVIVDARNQITESDENNTWKANNSFSAKDPTTLPNLTAPYFYWASTSPVAEGESYWIKSDIKNIGDGSAGASYAKAYLSTDNDFDITDDYYLGEKSVNSLGAGATQTIQWDFNFPNIGSGTYQVWIIVIVDARNQITESDENNTWKANNSFSAKDPTTLPNLTAPYFYWASTSPVAEGESYWIKSDIKNIGDGSAGASYAKAYLSTDNDFDITDDYYLGEKSVNSLGAGATQTIQWDFNFPNIGSGTYQVWIIVIVDARNQITESDENNTWKANDSFSAKDPTTTGTFQTTIQNIDGTSVPLPGANSSVKLYNSSNQLISTQSTNSNGIATFNNVTPGIGYYTWSYHNPSNPSTIFGQEFWGYKTGITITSGQTTSATFKRNMPYGGEVHVYNNITNQEIPFGGSITSGTQLRITFTVINPNFNESSIRTVKGRVIIDRDKATNYDFDSPTSNSLSVSPGNTVVFTYNYTPTQPGSYYRVTGTLIDFSGSYIYSDGTPWGSNPQFIVSGGEPDIDVQPTSLTINQSQSFQNKVTRLLQDTIISNYERSLHITPIKKDQIDSIFTDKSGKEVIKIKMPGKPPKNFRAPLASITLSAITITDVPAYDWSFGCTATSAAMLAGYYDRNGFTNIYNGPTNNGIMPLDNSTWGSVEINDETRSQCPLSASRNGIDGRTVRGHVDDYWIKYLDAGPDPFIVNSWTEHTFGDCLADYMRTNQSTYLNVDGSTWIYSYPDGSPLSSTNIDDGIYGMKLFFEARGYSIDEYYTQLIYGYDGNSLGFTFNQFKQEIDAGKLVLLQVEGHTMLGYGYDNASNTIYLHDTWDYNNHSMSWGGSYSGMQHWGVSIIHISGGSTDGFEIANVGSETLIINSITDDKNNPNWLLITGYPNTPFNVSSSGSQNAIVNIDWGLLGGNQQTGIITIASNDPDEPSINVNVTAIPSSTQPILNVTPAIRNVTNSSGSTNFSVSNNGTGSMDWTASVTSGNSWLQITNGSSGTNSGTINCSFSLNPNRIERSGTITVTAPGATGSPKNVTVTQAGNGEEYSVSILPNSQTVSGNANILIPLEIKIGDPSPVLSPDNFYGVSFNLNWDNTQYVEFSGIYSAGSWLGSNPLVLVQSFSNHLEIGLSKTAGTGVTGSGIVLLCSLKIKAAPPSEVAVTLTLSNIVATQEDGSSLNLSFTGASTVTLTIGFPVWPGDANNDGVVNAADVLPLGLYYNKTGAARSGGTCSWQEQNCPSDWSPLNATYADCNGNGIVNAADVLCIGLNYGNTHGALASDILKASSDITSVKINPETILRLKILDAYNNATSINDLKNGDYFYLGVSINDPKDIVGISFSINWGIITENVSALQVVEDWKDNGIKLSEAWGDKVISLSKPLSSEGRIDIGITKTDGIALKLENTELVIIKMKVIDKTNIGLRFENIFANDINGSNLNVGGIGLDKGLSKVSSIIPDSYSLVNYPNPFNPTTIIQVGIPEKSNVNLIVYNSLGQEIVKLAEDANIDAGVYEYEWDASNLPSGVYLYQLVTNKYSTVKKMLLIK